MLELQSYHTCGGLGTGAPQLQTHGRLAQDTLPDEILFVHAGHRCLAHSAPPSLLVHAQRSLPLTNTHTHTPARGGNRAKVCDFDWNPASRWCFASVSDDSADSGLGGGTLQLWRMWPAIAGLDDDVAAQVKHRMELLAGAS